MEDYSSAAEDRLADFNVLSNEKRKVCAIHIGGVYIECLLKAMLCCMNNVTAGSTVKKWRVNGVEVNRPSHILTVGTIRDFLPTVDGVD